MRGLINIFTKKPVERVAPLVVVPRVPSARIELEGDRPRLYLEGSWGAGSVNRIDILLEEEHLDQVLQAINDYKREKDATI